MAHLQMIFPWKPLFIEDFPASIPSSSPSIWSISPPGTDAKTLGKSQDEALCVMCVVFDIIGYTIVISP